MRLGLIGDVHAEHEFLDKAIRFLRDKQVDDIYCVGDVVDGRGCSNTCCDLLVTEKVKTVRGNHDRWIFEGKDDLTPLPSLSSQSTEFLKNLPVTLRVEAPFGGVLVCHGYGENDMARLGPDDRGYALQAAVDLHRLIDDKSLRLVINGHSHKRMVRKFNGLTVANIGTLHHEHQPCFADLDCRNGVLQFYNFGRDGAISAGDAHKLSHVKNEEVNYFR